MVLLSGLFAATNTHNPGGQGCLPGFRVCRAGGWRRVARQRGTWETGELRRRERKQTTACVQPERLHFYGKRKMKSNSIFRALLLLIAIVLTYGPANGSNIPLKREGGVHIVPIKINKVITLDFILDSGASEVCIPADVIMTLLRAHTIEEDDFLPGKSFSLADGSVMRSQRLIIRELELNGTKVFDVPALVAPVRGSLLLGQSFLQKLDSWTIDNKRHVLIVGNSAKHGNDTISPSLSSAGAQIFSPKDGDNVGRVCNVSGQIFGLDPHQKAFLVIHSTAQEFGRRVYPQGSIIPGEEGNWFVRGIYGTPNFAYRTYVVVTASPDSAHVLADESSRLNGLKELPSETEIISSIITVNRQ